MYLCRTIGRSFVRCHYTELHTLHRPRPHYNCHTHHQKQKFFVNSLRYICENIAAGNIDFLVRNNLKVRHQSVLASQGVSKYPKNRPPPLTWLPILEALWLQLYWFTWEWRPTRILVSTFLMQLKPELMLMIWQLITVLISITEQRLRNMYAVKSRHDWPYIIYSLNNQNNILCYRRFDFTSEVSPDEDFRCEV